MKTLGFIGCGNMGGAMIARLSRSGLYTGERLVIYDKNREALDRMCTAYGAAAAENCARLAEASDIVFLLVKPWQAEGVIGEIREHMRPGSLFVSIPLGLSLARLEALFGTGQKLVRVMPNTPAMIGEGMSGYCLGTDVTEEDEAALREILSVTGGCERVEESQMPAVTAVSGSAVAYVYMLIEAMADAAVREGLPREQSYRFAAQTVRGAAAMVQESGEHPAMLKDRVCTPGGSTIEALAVLEAEGFRSAVMKAMRSCAEKAGE